MNKYIEGFIKLNLYDTSDDIEKYNGPEREANKIQKCSILKTNNIVYSSNIKYTEATK